MTPDSKHAFHPDPESLSAFAEEALGAPEREQIVSHLAQCGRCRDIVFLAHQAASEMGLESQPELVAAAAAPQFAAATPRPPQRNWRFAFVPLAALAILVTIAYVVHLRRVQRAGELARVESATPSQTRSAPPPATSPEPVANQAQSLQPKAPSPPPSIVVAPAADKYIMRASDASPVAPPPAAQPTVPTTFTSLQDAQQQTAVAQAEAVAIASAARAKTTGVVHRQAMGAGLTASAPMPPQLSKPSPRSLGAERATAAGTFAAYKPEPVQLPSGLRAVSTATAQHRTVAVDSAGALFVGDPSAEFWQAVLQQWTGRIIAVRLQSAADANKQPGDAAVFEIVNDQGQVWVSTDGTVWKAK